MTRRAHAPNLKNQIDSIYNIGIIKSKTNINYNFFNLFLSHGRNFRFMWISLSLCAYQGGILRLGINKDPSSDPPPPKKRFEVPNVIIPNFSNKMF